MIFLSTFYKSVFDTIMFGGFVGALVTPIGGLVFAGLVVAIVVSFIGFLFNRKGRRRL